MTEYLHTGALGEKNVVHVELQISLFCITNHWQSLICRLQIWKKSLDSWYLAESTKSEMIDMWV